MSETHDPCQMVIRHDQVLMGNGAPGLADKVNDHDTFINQTRGVIGLFKWIGVGTVLGLVAQAITLIKIAGK